MLHIYPDCMKIMSTGNFLLLTYGPEVSKMKHNNFYIILFCSCPVFAYKYISP